jgi:hypothetical protein
MAETLDIRFKACVVFILLEVISGCSGITVSQDYDKDVDFTAIKTFIWMVDPDARQDDESEMSPLVAARVRNAIVSELKAKGIIYSEMSPDIQIDYNLKVESKISSSNVGTTIGFGTGAYGHAGGIVISNAPEIRQYDEGTLYIDFYTSSDLKLVWRGISSQIIDKHEEPDIVTEQVNLNVKKILEQFPPKVKGAG